MTFRQFAFHNVIRNKRLYAAYFFSSMFTVMVFFTFANFAFHPELSGANLNSSVVKGLSVAGGIIYVFSFFFVLYSMSAFLHSRKKEFGILFVHGMTSRQIRSLIFLENMLISLTATIFGVLLGLVFAKVILLIAENVLIMEQRLPFYFPTLAIVITFTSFIMLFFLISLIVPLFLRTKQLAQLIKGEQISKPEPKFSPLLVLLAIILIGIGYGIALSVTGLKVVAALFPVVIVVTIGTYFLFTQVSVWLIRKLKNKEKLFWKHTNMLLFADLAYRMKDNARAFFLVAIISTVAFSAIGTLIGLNSYLTKGIEAANPVTYRYIFDEDYADAPEKEVISRIEKTFIEHQLTYEKHVFTKHYFFQKEAEEAVYIAPVSDYNAYAQFIGAETISVHDHEAIPVDASALTVQSDYYMPDQLNAIQLADGKEIPVQWEKLGYAKRDILPEFYPYYIVSDAVYQQLAKPENEVTIYSWQVVKGSKEAILQAGEKLTQELQGDFSAVDYTVYKIRELFSPIMFVGLFIGIIFFVAAGSFLYFRLYTDLEADQKKFQAISKLGLTAKEISKVVSQQTAILFFTPISIALIHGAVALTALSRMFHYNLVQEATMVLGAFFFIQVVYFVFVRYFYVKQIQRAIT